MFPCAPSRLPASPSQIINHLNLNSLIILVLNDRSKVGTSVLLSKKLACSIIVLVHFFAFLFGFSSWSSGLIYELQYLQISFLYSHSCLLLNACVSLARNFKVTKQVCHLENYSLHLSERNYFWKSFSLLALLPKTQIRNYELQCNTLQIVF